MENLNLFKSFKRGQKDIPKEHKYLTDIPARVVEVILDEDNPDFNSLGRYDAVGAIKFRTLDSTLEEVASNKNLSVAYPLDPNIKQYPIKNEIILVTRQPTYVPSTVSRGEYATRWYWKPAVSIWNHPHHNANPDQSQTPADELKNGLDFKSDFIEADTINPLQPITGDILIEGRYGQSLRFSGTSNKRAPWSDDENNGKPITIFSNGQIPTDQGFKPIFEDVNVDFSSLYLTSDHKIDLQSTKKLLTAKSYHNLPKPDASDAYKGSQAILNADRVYLNAKQDGIFLNASQNIGIQSQHLNIDTDDYISLDSLKIFLGEKAIRQRDNELLLQPVIRGKDFEIWMFRLLDSIEQLGTTLSDSTLNTYGLVNKGGEQIKVQAQQLKEAFTAVKSKKVFTE